MNEVLKKLREPFKPEEIKWVLTNIDMKKKKAFTLAYACPRAVINKLNDCLGPEGWLEDYEINEKGIVCCLAINLFPENKDESYINKKGMADHTDSLKVTESEALFRACVKFGIGMDLYTLGKEVTLLDSPEKGCKVFNSKQHGKLFYIFQEDPLVEEKEVSKITKAKSNTQEKTERNLNKLKEKIGSPVCYSFLEEAKNADDLTMLKTLYEKYTKKKLSKTDKDIIVKIKDERKKELSA